MIQAFTQRSDDSAVISNELSRDSCPLPGARAVAQGIRIQRGGLDCGLTTDRNHTKLARLTRYATALDPRVGPKSAKIACVEACGKIGIAGGAGSPLRYHSRCAGHAPAPTTRAMHWSEACSSALV